VGEQAIQGEAAVQLQDRVIVVTGGARRLGKTYSLGLAKEGARVVVADLEDPSPVVEEITARGGKAMGVQVDICDSRGLDRMVEAVSREFGAIQVLLNNAGYFRDAAKGNFEDIPIEELDRSLTVNIKGTWLATKAVVPGMRAVGYGKVINVSSASVIKGQSATGPHYLTAKAALLGLTRALARELGPHNISVNSLLPDAIPDVEGDPGNEGPNRAIVARCFQRRQTPEDMVGTVVYLCGPGSDFVTGQSFHVNGGAYFT
jgi:NAD(P)-dependent dehydrogenase (short-subunit alcohol dehydrogenase family)